MTVLQRAYVRLRVSAAGNLLLRQPSFDPRLPDPLPDSTRQLTITDCRGGPIRRPLRHLGEFSDAYSVCIDELVLKCVWLRNT